MNLSKYIGMPVETVKAELEKNGSKLIEIKSNGSKKEKFDTVLVVKITKDDNNCIRIITDNFLLNI